MTSKILFLGSRFLGLLQGKKVDDACSYSEVEGHLGKYRDAGPAHTVNGHFWKRRGL